MPEPTIEQVVDMKAYLLTQMTLERAQGREDRVQIIQAILAMFDEPNKSYCDGWYKGYKEGWLKGCYDEKKRIVALEGPGEEERAEMLYLWENLGKLFVPGVLEREKKQLRDFPLFQKIRALILGKGAGE